MQVALVLPLWLWDLEEWERHLMVLFSIAYLFCNVDFTKVGAVAMAEILLLEWQTIVMV